MRRKGLYAAFLAVAVTAGLILAGDNRNVVSAEPANTTIECSMPLNFVCDVTDPDGISRILIRVHTVQGWIDAVDEEFPDCPTSATVGYDPIGTMAQVTITDCQLKLMAITLVRRSRRPITIWRSTLTATAMGRVDSVRVRPPSKGDRLEPRRQR